MKNRYFMYYSALVLPFVSLLAFTFCLIVYPGYMKGFVDKIDSIRIMHSIFDVVPPVVFGTVFTVIYLCFLIKMSTKLFMHLIEKAVLLKYNQVSPVTKTIDNSKHSIIGGEKMYFELPITDEQREKFGWIIKHSNEHSRMSDNAVGFIFLNFMWLEALALLIPIMGVTGKSVQPNFFIRMLGGCIFGVVFLLVHYLLYGLVCFGARKEKEVTERADFKYGKCLVFCRKDIQSFKKNYNDFLYGNTFKEIKYLTENDCMAVLLRNRKPVVVSAETIDSRYGEMTYNQLRGFAELAGKTSINEVDLDEYLQNENVNGWAYKGRLLGEKERRVYAKHVDRHKRKIRKSKDCYLLGGRIEFLPMGENHIQKYNVVDDNGHTLENISDGMEYYIQNGISEGRVEILKAGNMIFILEPVSLSSLEE